MKTNLFAVFFVCLAVAFGVHVRGQAPGVTYYYIDNGTAPGADDYLKETDSPAAAAATYWQVQLFTEDGRERENGWGAVSGPEWKYVLDQFTKEQDLEKMYQRRFLEPAPMYKEANYSNAVAPVAIRLSKKAAAQCREFITELPAANEKLNKHIDFLLRADKTIEDNADVLMSNTLRQELKNYAAEILTTVKNVRRREWQLTFEPGKAAYQLLTKGDYQGKGGIDDALLNANRLLPELERRLEKEYDPMRPVDVPPGKDG